METDLKLGKYLHDLMCDPWKICVPLVENHCPRFISLPSVHQSPADTHTFLPQSPAVGHSQPRNTFLPHQSPGIQRRKQPDDGSKDYMEFIVNPHCFSACWELQLQRTLQLPILLPSHYSWSLSCERSTYDRSVTTKAVVNGGP